MMYHAACKVEFQPFKRLYSQLTFFNFLLKYIYMAVCCRSLWVHDRPQREQYIEVYLMKYDRWLVRGPDIDNTTTSVCDSRIISFHLREAHDIRVDGGGR